MTHLGPPLIDGPRTAQSISGLWCSHFLAFSAWPPLNIDRCPSGSPLHSWSSSPCLKHFMIAFSRGSPFLAYSILLLVLPGSEGAGWGMSVSGDCSFPRRMLSGRRNRHEWTIGSMAGCPSRVHGYPSSNLV